MLLNIIQYTGQLHITKGYLTQDVRSVKVEDPHSNTHTYIPEPATLSYSRIFQQFLDQLTESLTFFRFL